MTRTTLLCPVYNSYLIFRANIESLLANVNKYNLLIVDDCSNDKKLLEYLEYLSQFPNIRIIKTGEPADCPHHNSYGRNILPPNKKRLSKGQGISINIGIEQVETEFVFIFDSDTLFLPRSKSLIASMEKCMDLEDKIMAVGQLCGKIDGTKIIHDKRPGIGAVNACAMMSRMSGWNKHGLQLLHNGGWCHEPYSRSIFTEGFKTCNFNVYKDGYLIHLGAGLLRTERPEDYAGNFAFTQDKFRKYGTLNPDGSIKDYYAGYYCIPFTTANFIKLLVDTYAELDFDIRENITEEWHVGNIK